MLNTSGIKDAIVKRGVIESLSLTDTESIPDTVSFVVGTEQFLLELPVTIDTAAEVEKATKELARLEGMEKGLAKKLGNERFVNNAPPAVVAKEQQKLADTRAKMEIARETIEKFGGAG